jgi:hypothetical protein
MPFPTTVMIAPRLPSTNAREIANITEGPGIAMITKENAMNGNRFWTGTTTSV